MLTRYCEYCGKDIKDSDVFCPHCGSNPIALYSISSSAKDTAVMPEQKSVA